MVDKLYALVNSDIEPDNLDALCNHEILLPGHLYLMILREKLEDCLSIVRAKIIKDCTHQDSKRVRESDYIKKVM
jgi:DNA-directed RNA polymerase I subunit RPA2